MSELANTLGAAYLGVLVAAVLYGLTSVQTYLYFHNCKRDRQIIKYLVIVLWVLDTIQFAMDAHAGYTYLVTKFGDFAAVLSPTWSILVQIYMTSASDSLVRIYFAWRVMVLCGQRRLLGKILYFSIIVCSLLAFISLTVVASRAFSLKYFDKIVAELSNVVYLGIGAALTGDIIVAVSLCTVFSMMRTGDKGTDSPLNFLLAFFINTGLLTCIVTISILITFIVLKQTLIWMAIFFTLGKLYTNALLASLNARSIVYRDNFNGNPNQNTEELPVSCPIHFKTVVSTVDEYYL